MSEKVKKDFFEQLKPLLKKLLVGLVTFLIATNGFVFFDKNKSSVINIIDFMQMNIITDVKFLRFNQTCPVGYIQMNYTEISGNFEGCMCDGFIYDKKRCRNNPIKPDLKQCDYINDDFFNGSIYNNDLNPECNAFCCKCFSKIEENRTNHHFHHFYDNSKICYEVDYYQTTYTYLSSFLYSKCDYKCNEIFCKYNNNDYYKCPITNVKKYEDKKQKIENLNSKDNPILFNSTYKAFNDFDDFDHPKYSLPIIEIFIGNNFGCSNNKKAFYSSFPLIEREICYNDIRNSIIDDTNYYNLIKINKMDKYFQNNYPMYETILSWDPIKLQGKHFLSYSLINCIMRKTDSIITDDLNETERNRRKEKMNIYVTTLLAISDVYYFIETTTDQIIGIQSLIIAMTILTIMVKLFNCCYDYMKPIFVFYIYESFISLFFDFITLIIAGNSNKNLIYYEELFNGLLEPDFTDCLGEYGTTYIQNINNMTGSFKDSHFSIVLISLLRFGMITISLCYYLITKKKINYRKSEIYSILLEQDNEEEPDEINTVEEEEEESENLKSNKNDKDATNEEAEKDKEKELEKQDKDTLNVNLSNYELNDVNEEKNDNDDKKPIS